MKNKKLIIGLCILIMLITILSAMSINGFVYWREISDEGTSNIALAVNGSAGFDGSIIWTNAHYHNNATLEYNDTSTYAVVINGTTEGYYETEGGGDTNGRTSVYRSDNEGTWHMNNLSDSTSNGHDLSNNGADSVSTCAYDDCYDFVSANTDYMTSSSDDLGSTYSISLWVNMDTVGATEQYLVAGDDSTNRYDGQISYYQGFRFVGHPDDMAMQTEEISADSWYHIVGVCDGTSKYIYVNGVLNKSNTTANTCDWDTGRMIGRREDNSRYLDGTLDELRYYDSVLNATEILELYNNRNNTGNAGAMTLGSDRTFNQTPNATFTANITEPLYNSNDASVTVLYADVEGDTGIIYWEWFVDGVSVWNETDSGISNATTTSATLTSGNYTTGQLVNVSATPSDSNSNGTTVWSNTVNVTVTPNPTFTLNTPTNAGTTSSINVTLNVTIIDLNDTVINWTAFYNNATGLVLYNETDVANNTNVVYDWNNLNYSTTYYWYAQAEDNSTGSVVNSSVWSFTTPTPTTEIYWDNPTNNTQHNTTSLLFNYTIYTDHTDVKINCSLLRNGAIVQNSTNLTGDNSTIYNFTENYLAGTEAEYNYSIRCLNGYVTDTETNRTIYIDIVSPTMNVSLSDNNTYLIPGVFDNNLTFQINVTDPFLYSLNITDSNGYSNYTNLTGLTSYIFNGTINVSAYPIGKHWVNAEVCDGHTDKELKQDWNVDIGWLSDAITFETETGWTKVYPESWFEMEDVRVDKLKDRYTFDFTMKENKDKLVLYVESSSYIDILGNKSKYPGHLVIPAQKKWVDFDAQDDSLDYKVKRIESNLVEITISGLKDKEIKFKSIGELNCISTNSTFSIMNTTWTYDVGILETNWGLHTLNISWEGIGNACDPTTWSAYLNWNTTDNVATKQSTGTSGDLTWNYFVYNKTAPAVVTDTNYPVKWRIKPTPNCYGGSLTGDITSNVYTNLTTFNQSVGSFIFDNCSTANVTALNFTLKDESNLSIVNGTIDYTFTFSRYLIEYIGLENGSSSYDFCISPGWAEIYGDFEIEYTAPGYATRYYAVDNHFTSNATEQITLYLITNTSSETTFEVSDKDTSDLLEDVLVTMYRYLNGSWASVESKHTDITGRAKLTYEPSTKYNFVMSKTLYEDLEFSLDPILYTEYSVQLEKSTSLTEAQDYDNIKISYTPQQFTTGVQNFTFTFNGITSNLNEYGVDLTYPGGTDSDTGTIATGETFDFNINISGVNVWDRVQVDYYYDTDLSGTREFTIYLPITASNNTFMHNVGETYGLGLFERVLIVTFILLFIIGIGTMMGQTIPALALSMVVLGFLIYSGFVPIWSFVISIILGVLFLTWLGD